MMNENAVVFESKLSESEVHCKHFVKRKKRFCKMTIKKGQEYCGEHLPSPKNEEEDNKTLRIVCPLDKKHTCYAFKLEKHLKICNARPNVSLPYILKGVNCGEVNVGNEINFVNLRQLSAVEPEAITDLVKRINRIYEDIVYGKIVDNFKNHILVEEEIKKPEYGDRTKKHLIQASSIVGLLAEHELLKSNTCYIEFGAGKGQLSFWISQAISEYENSSILLVERASHRHKYDNKLDKSDGKVNRIKADIADLVLSKVEAVNGKNIVGLTKHLCGDATDLALRCMRGFELHGGKVAGLIMAFCCHHRCQWSTYTGKQFFEKCGLAKSDFDTMCGMVSWAICGSGMSRKRKNCNDEERQVQNERDALIGLSREQKEEVGRRCKNILDYGRLHYLEEAGFNCNLNYYVEPKISLENVCIIAKK